MKVTDTIAAISTPRGVGGIAVIRICGGDAFDVAERIFKPVSGRRIGELPGGSAVYGHILHGGDVIDDGIAAVFRAPKSFTGEDTVEISCHGGVLVTNKVLEIAISAGARPAEAGEFTRRAFISGKLTLSEAEAVGDLLYARTEGQLKLAGAGNAKRLSSEAEAIGGAITRLLARISVTIDYPEEDLADIGPDEIMSECKVLRNRIEKLAGSYKTGKAVSSGIDAVICGKPNAGKSTLYNLLCGSDDAIVTDIAGTTRDVLTSEVSVGDVLLKLSDTAGIRSTEDRIEQAGVEKARKKITSAELMIAVFDASSKPDGDDEELLMTDSPVRLAVINKCDVTPSYADEYVSISKDAGVGYVMASLSDGDGYDRIAEFIKENFTEPTVELGRDAVISNARQAAEASSALDAVVGAVGALEDGMPVDVAAGELEEALRAVSRLDGKDVSDAVISEIFSHFCVGK